MLEVIVFVAVVILILVLSAGYYSLKDKMAAGNAQLQIKNAEEKLKIAERKFMQGKIKKSVFDSIVDDIEEEMLSAEMALLRITKSKELSVEEKTLEIMKQIERPTKHRMTQVQKILEETEILRKEMSMLEGKLLKREIKQSVFEKLVKEKETEMIKKEKDLMDIVAKSSN